jgi:RNA polymerase sigma-70 factor (ECF subfamily)
MEKHEFARFYKTHFERIYKFVYFRVGGRKEVAQDLTQDVFLKAFQAFDRYDPAISQSSWIYTIARNHVINHHAKTKPGVDLEEVEGSLSASVDMRETFAMNYEEKQLCEAMGKLPKEDADLVRMKYLEGWQFDELAEIIGKNSGALRVQARRAIKKLYEILKPTET